ncbi:sensor domain-containing diguanylate cyclase [Deinococcus ruber]|uniref:Sensor histidine kinase n=1 Tax=Deinococcus ruber TaxID=1848197 RepID=A0A918CH88_9DEIO|nr:diguanylate cyclase [Deinococcus ruber]GGR23525.1 sensor histidine kinase [Deinococcus ruber]
MQRLSTYLLKRQLLLWTVFLVVGSLSGKILYDVAVTNHRTTHTQQDMIQMQALLTTVLNLETGLRGYALTGLPTFLEPYTSAAHLVAPQLHTLRRAQLTDPGEDSAAQLHRLNRIRDLLHRWMTEIAGYDIQQRPHHPERVLAREHSRLGKTLIDGVRREINDYLSVEQHALTVRAQQAQHLRALTELATLLSGSLAVLLSIISSLIVAHTLSRKFHRFATAAEQLIANQPGTDLGTFHIQEADQLARSFKRMASHLHESHTSLTRQNAELQEHNAAITATNALAVQLQSCLTLEEGVQVLEQTLPLIFPQLDGQVAVLNVFTQLLEVRVRWGNTPPAALTFHPQQCLAVRRSRLGDPQEEPFSWASCPLGQHPHICLPLTAQEDVIGHLQLSPLPEEPAQQHVVHALAKAIATPCALGLANLRLQESLRQQSLRDPLTSLYNRRYLDETFERELGRAMRHNQPLAVLMVDVDHFKRFNDTYGHDAGDQVLIQLGKRLRDHFRLEDIVCRYGGEEFAVVMPAASLDGAVERAEDLRTALARLNVTLNGTSQESMTVSIGVSVYPLHGDDTAVLLRRADQALYRAKQAGRNQVRVATP